MSQTAHRPWRPSWKRALVATATAAAFGWLARRATALGLAHAPDLLAAIPGLKLELVANSLDRLRQAADLMILAWLAAVLTRLFSARYRMAGGELTIAAGLLARSTHVIPVSRVRRFELRQTPVARLLRYGTIVVEDGTPSPTALQDVEAPAAVLAALQEAAARH